VKKGGGKVKKENWVKKGRLVRKLEKGCGERPCKHFTAQKGSEKPESCQLPQKKKEKSSKIQTPKKNVTKEKRKGEGP